MSRAKTFEGAPLTPTELIVAKLMAQGVDGRDIAEQIGHALQTYDTHRHAVLVKLGIRGSNAAALVAQHAIREGWITVSSKS